MEEQETQKDEREFIDKNWVNEAEVGDISEYSFEYTYGGKKHTKWMSVISINTLQNESIRKRHTRRDDLGRTTLDTDRYNDELLIKCVIDPKTKNNVLNRQMLDNIKRNKKSGVYFEMLNIVLKHIGIAPDDTALEEEKK